ncbi:MAG: cyclodeaminase/cyclohydrolase family protein [Lachnospiraceae bacterium]|nr:cyclodeaminase/cyclohydrolase family protein [Lachnospiraceae bacterium]
MDLTGLSCREFADVLASSEPTPGGGGAAALVGALGAALALMVGNLTVGKKKYADVAEEISTLMEETEELKNTLIDQIEADAEGFLPLAMAYRMSKDDPEREVMLEEASKAACTVPLKILELACKVIDCTAVFAAKGSKLAVSDAGCAAVICRSALKSAALNVFINTKGLKDRVFAQRTNDRCEEMMEKYCALADDIYEDVKRQLKAD